MKLYIKQKIFSWRSRFSVKDKAENDLYYVEGELFSWGKKLHIMSADGTEAAFVQQKVMSFLPRFLVFAGGRQIAEIVKEFTLFHPRYRIEGLDWKIDGDFWDHEYEITSGGARIAAIHKEWLTWGDCYVLDIEQEHDEIPALAVVLAIDCVIESANAATSAPASTN